ncbi:MAG TPA: sulfotransferase domain-containing protein [Thermoanaerobaculia bacterium]|nr:sulfotransferase domain-containing protein [Thermoanaerobaculia bacterium]
MRDRLVLWYLRTALAASGRVSGFAASLHNSLLFHLGFKLHFKVRPDDIFVATYPKSGTTLTQMILYQLTTDGSMDFPHVDAVMPFYELEFMRGLPARFEALPSPRVFKSHLLREHLPDQARYIYVTRNLEDVAVSAYHHYCLVTGVENDFTLYTEAFAQGGVPMFNSWVRHFESWWPRRNDPNVLFLRYEEMVRDLEGAVRRIAGFCGIPVDEAAMPRILERCGLEFMKRHEDKFDPRFHRISGHQGVFIRKGGTGEGAPKLSAAQQEKLEERVAALARKLGCSDRELSGTLSRSQPIG